MLDQSIMPVNPPPQSTTTTNTNSSGQDLTGSPTTSQVQNWYSTSPYQQTAPQNTPGLVASQQPAPQVTAPNSASSVATVDPNSFSPSTAPNAKMTGATGTASTYAPNLATGTNWSVNNPQTVAGQVNGLIAANSPLMQQAEYNSKAAAEQKGLLNSSMAVGAGQSAVIASAMPIAQQDANTFANSAKYNADVANTTSQFNANANNSAGQFNTAAQNTQSLTTQQEQQQANLTNTQQANALQAQGLQQKQQVLQGNQQASNANLSQSNQMSMVAQTANQSAAVQQAAQVYDAGVKMAMQNTDAAGKLQLQQVDAATRTNLATIQAHYNVQMQTSASMASTYQAYINQTAAIMADQNLDAAGKTSAINNLSAQVNDAMALQSSMSGLNLGTIIDPSKFGVVPASPSGGSSAAPAPAPAPSSTDGGGTSGPGSSGPGSTGGPGGDSGGTSSV